MTALAKEAVKAEEVVAGITEEDFSQEAVTEQHQHLAKMVVAVAPEMDVAVQVCKIKRGHIPKRNRFKLTLNPPQKYNYLLQGFFVYRAYRFEMALQGIKSGYENITT